MRSRKPSPGLAVMRTISQSESTRVPPVTLERSPPLSRITGALSPVIVTLAGSVAWLAAILFGAPLGSAA